MNLVLVTAIGFLTLIVLSVLVLRKVSQPAPPAIDLTPVVNGLNIMRTVQEQTDRSIREETSHNRQEHSVQAHELRGEVLIALNSIGESVSSKLEGLTLSNDQKFEFLRAGMEQRLDFFTVESGHKIDSLTQSVMTSAGKLQDEVSAKLGEFKNSLEATVSKAHQLQHEQTKSLSETLQALRSSLEEKQFQFHSLVDSKLSTLGQQSSQKLTDLKSALSTDAQELRKDTATSFQVLGESVLNRLTEISQLQKNELQELRSTVDNGLSRIHTENEKKLEQIRVTVDEKLQGTLEARLGESFKQVSERLEQVYRGLGEMQNLAVGVGDLKRVLTNVKTRGTWGEIQLGALLEQILAPEQYAQNVATSGTDARVEFAIKLPGRDNNDSPVWLPIDAKFPVEDYQRLVEASEKGDTEAVDKASRQLEGTLKLCAKTVSEKYLAPPSTTDFGILFLSTEGLYAEAIRRPGLAESIQREQRVILTGPSTLAALLNSFQMGFRTLAIQRRSSEVWEILGVVKSEFAKYAEVLARVKKKLGEAQNTIDKAETRTRAIQRKLREVETSDSAPLLEGRELDEDDIENASVLAGVGERE